MVAVVPIAMQGMHLRCLLCIVVSCKAGNEEGTSRIARDATYICCVCIAATQYAIAQIAIHWLQPLRLQCNLFSCTGCDAMFADARSAMHVSKGDLFGAKAQAQIIVHL